MPNAAKTRFTLDVTQEEDKLLTRLAKERGVSKAAILRESLGLFDVASNARKHNEKVCIVNEKNKMMREVVLTR